MRIRTRTEIEAEENFEDENIRIRPSGTGKINASFLSTVILVLAFGLLAEMLIFMHSQTDKLADKISQDFVIQLTANSSVTADKIEELTEKIRQTSGVEEVTPVSKTQLLERIKQDDTEKFVESVMQTGKNENPLPDIWEVRIKQDSLASFENVKDDLLVMEEISEAYYKKKEAESLQYFVFYKYFTSISMLFSAIAVIVFFIIGFVGRGMAMEDLIGEDLPYFFAGIVSAFVSFGITYLFLFPVRSINTFGGWSFASQFVFFLCCGILGWGIRICQKNS